MTRSGCGGRRKTFGHRRNHFRRHDNNPVVVVVVVVVVIGVGLRRRRIDVDDVVVVVVGRRRETSSAGRLLVDGGLPGLVDGVAVDGPVTARAVSGLLVWGWRTAGCRQPPRRLHSRSVAMSKHYYCIKEKALWPMLSCRLIFTFHTGTGSLQRSMSKSCRVPLRIFQHCCNRYGNCNYFHYMKCMSFLLVN